MSKSPAFQFYPDHYLSSESVQLMTLEQQGAYMRLLCYDWLKDGLKKDGDRLAALSGLNEGWFKGGSTIIQECFIAHPNKEGYITNPRLLKEREKQQKWREKSSAGGKKSAASRRRSKTLKGGSQMVQTKTQPTPNSISISSSTIKNNIDTNITPLPPKGERVPFDEMIQIFRNTVLALPTPKLVTPQRKTAMKGRWQDIGNLDKWREICVKISESDFLCGREEGNHWQASFDWCLKSSNYTKIVEGNYDNKTAKVDTGAKGKFGF